MPYLWLGCLLVPALLWACVAIPVLVVDVAGGETSDYWRGGFVVGAVIVGLPALAVAAWVGHHYRNRRRVLAGQRVPVTVYYGRLPDQSFPVPPRLKNRYRTPRYAGVLFWQPLLLIVADDGRMWTALPDQMSSHAPYQPTTGRNNPWITPLLSLRDEAERPVIDPKTAQRRRLPVDLGAPGNQPTLDALRHLGQPDPDDPPESRSVELYRNDPRTYGGPVPGELLLPSEGRFAGLVLHRPADAPATSTPPA